ncbi:Dynein light chain [Spironucleus salmonicida]|uniref:Dynein light chain n=1 Tax=Spironucleus salmonicida TaxID=348837 RepID=V6LU83_9EUKA|nr:Dynein light chain [Spironucleus salmonicida]|eukprot:EST48167.1 Dynein light chain [Spironucleus salmonicida]
MDITHLHEIYDSFDYRQRGVIEMWKLRELLAAAELNPTDEQLFNLISDADINGDGLLSFPEFQHFVQELSNAGKTKDADMDLLNSWILLGGSSDKNGAIKVQNIKVWIQKFGFIVDIEKNLKAQIEKKLQATIIGAGKKVIVPEDIDFEDFRVLMGEAIYQLPRWVMHENEDKI